ncbi:hypothetical protein Pse7367_3409 [Thalassoporum mexicanum PCC 7367]|uniref:DUF3352 domain-containing protein n=1 Tax=Thalassoporum mexicanum TaxID=3457544 RepID=UPI00029FF66F|nr:DUF3352 domain-containing protein [Pseudanabaena sp. PCC 7367]AFY71646.1 hypothetical protein Pse7367_3409 [Pseudanabaena sp. PCC 7367]
MSEKKSSLVVPLVGAAVVAAGGVGAYLFTKSGPGIITSGGGEVATAEVVPSNAFMAISISTDESAWAQLDQFQTPETKQLYDEAIAELKTEVFEESEFDFDADIKPWAGEVMIALLPPTAPQASLPGDPNDAISQVRYAPVIDGQLAQVETEAAEAEPNIMMVVEVKDEASASSFANKVKEKSGEPTKQTYQDYEISTYPDPDGGEPTNTVLLGDYLVISPQPGVLEQSIDTFKGGNSFASSIDAGTLGIDNPVIQVYIPNFSDSIAQIVALSPDSEDIPPQSLEQLQQIKSISMGVGIESEGIRLKAVTKLDPNALEAKYETAPGEVISQFPAETFALITGNNLKARWELFTKEAAKTPEIQEGLDQIRTQMQSALQLDLDQDIFGWMDGEFAIGSVANSEGILATFGAGMAMIFKTSDRPTAEATLAKLEELATTSGGISVSSRETDGGVTITEWTAPGAPGTLFGYSWYEQDSLVLAIGPLVETMATKPATPLSEDANYKTIISSLESSNIGYFYLDMEQAWSLLQAQIPPEEVTPEAQAMVNAIRGVGVTASMPDKTTSNFEFLLALKKANQ